MTPAKKQPTGADVAAGCSDSVVYLLVSYLVLTPLIMIAWNVGLEPAGITSNQIGWWTGLGLATVFILARSFIRGALYA